MSQAEPSTLPWKGAAIAVAVTLGVVVLASQLVGVLQDPDVQFKEPGAKEQAERLAAWEAENGEVPEVPNLKQRVNLDRNEIQESGPAQPTPAAEPPRAATGKAVVLGKPAPEGPSAASDAACNPSVTARRLGERVTVEVENRCEKPVRWTSTSTCLLPSVRWIVPKAAPIGASWPCGQMMMERTVEPGGSLSFAIPVPAPDGAVGIGGRIGPFPPFEVKFRPARPAGPAGARTTR